MTTVHPLDLRDSPLAHATSIPLPQGLPGLPDCALDEEPWVSSAGTMAARQRNHFSPFSGISFQFAAFLMLLSWAAIATAQPFASDPLACDLPANPAQGEWKPLTLPDSTKLEWRIGMQGEDLRSIDLRYPGGNQGRFLAGTRVVRCGEAFPQDALYILLMFKNSIVSEASHILRMPGFPDRLGAQIDTFAASLQTALKIPTPTP